MSYIVSVDEHYSGRRGNEAANGRQDYTRMFLVVASDVSISAQDILDNTDIPDIGDKHPDNSKALCISVDPTPYGDERISWMVDVKYTTGERPRKVKSEPRPWNRVPKVKWGMYSVTEGIGEDQDGAALVNTAGDPFDPSISIEVHRPILTLTRYEKDFDINTALEYIDKVNLAAMTICGKPVAAEGALITRYDANNVDVDNVGCWAVTYEIMFADTWRRKVVSSGFYYYPAGVSANKTRIQENGEDKVTASLLQSDGQVADSTNFYTHEFKLYLRKDFGPLGLPVRAP